MMNSLISFVEQVMEARVTRLNLLMQQVERTSESDACGDVINCCPDGQEKTKEEVRLNYYIHK